MRENRFIFVLLLCMAAQVTLVRSVAVFGVAPDLLLACVAMATFVHKRSFAFLVALACGLFKDSFGLTYFGTHTLLYPCACLVLLELCRAFVVDTPVLASAVVVCLSLAYALAERVVSGSLGFRLPLLVFLKIAFLQAVYTAAVVPVLMRLLRRPSYA